MKKSSESRYPVALFDYLFSTIFFVAYFFYTLFYVHPEHYSAWKNPVFFTSMQFFRTFTTRPGGMLEYFAAFLEEFYIYPWVGALILTSIALLITLTLAVIFKKLEIRNKLYFLPAVCLVALQANYRFLTEYSLGFLFAFAALYIFLLLPANKTLRTIAMLVFSVILYVGIAMPFLLMTLCAALIEVKQRKNYAAIFAFVAAAFLPWFAQFFFPENSTQPFLYLLPFVSGYQMPFVAYIYILSVPVLLVIFLWMSKSTQLPVWAHFLQYGVFIALAVWFGLKSYDKDFHQMVTIDQLAEQRDWDGILAESKKHYTFHRLANFQIAQALFNRGLLLEDYLKYVHPNRQVEAFWMVKDVAFSAPMDESDFCLEMGNVNEAEHWAHEALSICGPTPRILERLIQTNLLRNNYAFAMTNYKLLLQSPVGKKNALTYKDILKDHQPIDSNPYLAKIEKRQIHHDFHILDYSPRFILGHVLEVAPGNRMAFDYMMLYILLNGKSEELMANAKAFKRFGYPEYPRLVNEALLLYAVEHAFDSQQLQEIGVNPISIGKFKAYNEVLQKYNGNVGKAQRELQQKFGDTYWYYLMYTLKQFVMQRNQGS